MLGACDARCCPQPISRHGKNNKWFPSLHGFIATFSLVTCVVTSNICIWKQCLICGVLFCVAEARLWSTCARLATLGRWWDCLASMLTALLQHFVGHIGTFYSSRRCTNSLAASHVLHLRGWIERFKLALWSMNIVLFRPQTGIFFASAVRSVPASAVVSGVVIAAWLRFPCVAVQSSGQQSADFLARQQSNYLCAKAWRNEGWPYHGHLFICLFKDDHGDGRGWPSDDGTASCWFSRLGDQTPTFLYLAARTWNDAWGRKDHARAALLVATSKTASPLAFELGHFAEQGEP